MRVLVIVKATKESEVGIKPGDEKMLKEMGAFNEELVKAGIMLAGEGLKPSRYGKRVKFSGNSRTVTDGPFAETKEQLGGYHLVECSNLDEALSIAMRIPTLRVGGTVEVRPLDAVLDATS